jgi:hypothetical protein
VHGIHLLPPLKARYEAYEPSGGIVDSCLLAQEAVFDILRAEGVEPANKLSAYSFPRHSWVDAPMGSSSATDLNSISLDVDSGASTPAGGPKVAVKINVLNIYRPIQGKVWLHTSGVRVLNFECFCRRVGILRC